MICPMCKKETPSIIRECQFCKADLEVHRKIIAKELEDPEWDRKGFRLIDLGPTAGIIMVVFAALSFVIGMMEGVVFAFSPILFFAGIGAIVVGLKRR